MFHWKNTRHSCLKTLRYHINWSWLWAKCANNLCHSWKETLQRAFQRPLSQNPNCQAQISRMSLVSHFNTKNSKQIWKNNDINHQLQTSTLDSNMKAKIDQNLVSKFLVLPHYLPHCSDTTFNLTLFSNFYFKRKLKCQKKKKNNHIKTLMIEAQYIN